MRAETLITRFEQFAPQALAVPGDPIGLQIGRLDQPVHKVLVTLDVRPEVVQEAIANGADMIFAHHPAMFRPVQPLDLAVPQNEMYAECVRHGILVYAAHTNLDRAAGGMNDWLAQAMQLTAVRPFIDDGPEAGMGRIGELPQALRLADFAAQLKTTFALAGLRVIATDLNRQVRHIAVLGGDGGKFFRQAQLAGADVYVTGDVYYHTGHDMLAYDLPVIDPGHHIEAIMKKQVASMLQDWAATADWPITVLPSALNTDPFTFL
ncbi:Nif3-like dinuclear metal center hexameric protein [Lacticaseibacillus baoqingensis]|uniref:GTP cyclohydrolase 1 type 2 homolog n=1 Tax=Lacticaseibacillus baoqingensis TaxID=2486013 RepID=A0ABW4EB59_9LACO|nr:Nif3-like dinuclear metal center hexameric protein [Lacticaseibacillus baoqingensis]